MMSHTGGSSGSSRDDFAAQLAERERRVWQTATVTPAPPDAPATEPEPLVDRHGAHIVGGVSGIGPSGQYRVISPWDGRTLRVCGEAASEKHLLLWVYDADERRYVCGLCWPELVTGKTREHGNDA